MNRLTLLCGLGMVWIATTAAQEAQTRQPAEGRASQRTTRLLDALDTQVIEQLELPVASTSVDTLRANPDLLRSAAQAAAAAGRRGAAAAGRGRAAQAARTVTLDLEAMSRRIGKVSGIQIARDRQQVTPPAEQRAVTLRRGELLAVRRAGSATTITLPGPTDIPADPGGPAGERATASPTVLYTVDDAGRLRELGLVHRTAGLHWQPDRGRFAGELLVGILDRENPLASGPLGANIPIQLLAESGTVAEPDLQVDRIGVPFQRVAVEVAAPDDPFSIAFVSQIDLDLPPAALPVVRPQLLLTAPEVLPGLGVGEADITVSALDSSLRPGQAITLDLDNGWIADRIVLVGDTGTASTRIRSDWLGRGTLRIVAPATYAAAPKDIRYTTPVRFIVATLIGGMLGAFVLVHRLQRTEPEAHRSYAMDWVAGVIVGVAATVMAYAGMKLPEWIPMPVTLAGEAAPFALSFICAAAGTGLIRTIVGAGERTKD
jgi:hypothetical protein